MTADGDDLLITLDLYGTDLSDIERAIRTEAQVFGARVVASGPVPDADGSIVLIKEPTPGIALMAGDFQPLGNWRPTLYLGTSGAASLIDVLSTGQEGILFSGNVFTRRDVTTGVRNWLHDQFGEDGAHRRSTADGRNRAAVEALSGYVATILDNGYLRNLVAELKAELKATQGELTVSQVEARTFATLYEQLKLDNEALKLELSKARVDPRTAGLRTKAMKLVAAGLFTSGFLGQVAANEFDRKAHPDEYELHQARTELPQRCETTINIFDNSDTFILGGEATWQMPIEQVGGHARSPQPDFPYGTVDERIAIEDDGDESEPYPFTDGDAPPGNYTGEPTYAPTIVDDDVSRRADPPEGESQHAEDYTLDPDDADSELREQ